ncbi:MAG: DUF2029 domain-containing protein [Armatimonadetes bacterium]|nr:DUF2029 domain-containing protein [Armatimonadota bacterium]
MSRGWLDRLLAWGLWAFVLCVALPAELPRVLREAHEATDFTAYTQGGRYMLEGRSPYRLPSSAGWHYLYPPFFGLLLAPLAGLSERVQASLALLCNLALLLAMVSLCRRLAETCRGDGETALPWWLLAAGYLAFWPFCRVLLNWGQVGLLLTCLTLLGYRLARHGRSSGAVVGGGLALAMSSAIKVTPLLAALAVLAMRGREGDPLGGRRRRLLAAGLAGGLALFIVVLPALRLGWRANLALLAEFRDYVVLGDEQVCHWPASPWTEGNLSLVNSLRVYCHGPQSAPAVWDRRTATYRRSSTPFAQDPPEFARWAKVAWWVAALLGAAAILRLARRTESADHLAALALAQHLGLLLAPVSWVHAYVSVFVMVLFVPLRLLRTGRPVLAALMATTAWVTVAIGEAWLSMIAFAGLGLAVWFALACLLALSETLTHRLESGLARVWWRATGVCYGPVR